MATGFGFVSVEHFCASAMHDLQKAMFFVEQNGAKVQKAEGTVEGLTSLLPNGATAVVLERAAFQALGLLVSAVTAADAASAQDGLNLKLDAATVAAFRELVAECKAGLSLLGYKL